MFAFVSTVTTVSNANIFAHGSHTDHGFLFAARRSRFLNTNRTNLTNILLHTDLTLTDFLAYGLLLLWNL